MKAAINPKVMLDEYALLDTDKKVKGTDRVRSNSEHKLNVHGEPIAFTPEDVYKCFLYDN